MPADLSGPGLDRAIALAAIPFGYKPPVGIDEDGAEYERLESFSTNLNALRDGTEKVLRERGLICNTWQPYEGRWNVYWFFTGKATSGYLAHGDTEAEARARATLAALEAMK